MGAESRTVTLEAEEAEAVESALLILWPYRLATVRTCAAREADEDLTRAQSAFNACDRALKKVNGTLEGGKQ